MDEFRCYSVQISLAVQVAASSEVEAERLALANLIMLLDPANSSKDLTILKIKVEDVPTSID